MANLFLVAMMILGMFISFELGKMQAFKQVEEILDDEITDEEVEKMVGGTD